MNSFFYNKFNWVFSFRNYSFWNFYKSLVFSSNLFLLKWYHFVCAGNRTREIIPSLLAGGFLSFTVTFALRTDVIPQHRSQNEVFFGRKQIERSVCQKTDSPNALRTAEEQIDARVRSWLYEKIYVLAP